MKVYNVRKKVIKGRFNSSLQLAKLVSRICNIHLSSYFQCHLSILEKMHTSSKSRPFLTCAASADEFNLFV